MSLRIPLSDADCSVLLPSSSLGSLGALLEVDDEAAEEKSESTFIWRKPILSHDTKVLLPNTSSPSVSACDKSYKVSVKLPFVSGDVEIVQLEANKILMKIIPTADPHSSRTIPLNCSLVLPTDNADFSNIKTRCENVSNFIISINQEVKYCTV